MPLTHDPNFIPSIDRLKNAADVTGHMMVTEWIDGAIIGEIVISGGVITQVNTENGEATLLNDGDAPGQNYGFRAWVDLHATELLSMGDGAHRGYWWGQGMGPGYGLNERRFSLLDITRWWDLIQDATKPGFPTTCCHIMPPVRHGNFYKTFINDTLTDLIYTGSWASNPIGWGHPGGFRPCKGAIFMNMDTGEAFKATLANYREQMSKAPITPVDKT